MYSKLNVGKSILVGMTCCLLWLRETGKGIEKAKRHYWHFIYENNGKYEKEEVKGHRLHVRRKMKENNGK